MRRTMIRRLSWLVLAACGGSPGPRAPHADAPHLEPHVAEQTWYRATSICGQGPYEVELPTTGARWGEDVELLVHTPRALALHAEVLADATQVTQTQFGSAPANARCIADVKERLALARAGGGTPTTGGTPVETGTTVIAPPPAAAPPALVIEQHPVTTSEEVLRFHLPDRATPHIKIRFWSVEPNDLEGVFFGAAHIIWQPTIPDAQYEAYLVDQQHEAQVRAEREAAEWARTHPARAVDPREEERRRADEEDRRRRAEEADRRRRAEAEREEQRRQIAAALEEQRRQQRAAYCAAHADDRDCWGAGGLRVHLDLQRHERERADYCAAHAEDARCWSTDEWARRRTAWNARLAAAQGPACQPTGAPPAALAETQPPALSPHATWRPGYYQWAECTWVWLAGQWRVPDSDLVAETTTTAPAAPPPMQSEAPPPAPIRTAVWIPGFWQWSGAAWVWVAGSWQLRPSATVEWRPAEWRARGSVHVLVPGGWIHAR